MEKGRKEKEEVRCSICGNVMTWDKCDSCASCEHRVEDFGTDFCPYTGKEHPQDGCSLTVCRHCHKIGERIKGCW